MHLAEAGPSSKITDIIEVDRHVSSRSIAQELKLGLELVLQINRKRAYVVSYRVLKMEVNKEKIRFFLQFSFDKGENARQVFLMLKMHLAEAGPSSKITDIIEVDRHVSSRSIAQELKIDHKTVLSHLRKVGFKKKLGLVPYQLTPKNIMDQISIDEALFKQNEIDPFLKRMMTGDEKWVTYNNIVRK
ncbi:histone-lysine N-methyltransferase SETMAR [Trichonephila clavipes]|nr:histone-lysine N-methyltransferase SETMAR [Trichonephila clavipes]